MPLTGSVAALRRGLLCGLLAGALGGLFATVAGGPLLEEAIALEAETRGAVPLQGPDAADDVHVARSTQRLGLVLAVGLVGGACGGLFALVRRPLRDRVKLATLPTLSLRLGMVLFAATAVLPSVVYPPELPGTTDPTTVAARSTGYLLVVSAGLMIALATWHLLRWSEGRGLGPVARRLLATVWAAFAITVVLLVLPTYPPVAPPGELLWRFRSAAVGTQFVLWAGIAVGFRLLCDRRGRDRTLVEGC